MLQTTFLWYLVQINHYQSLSIAAEQLHVSQPALSAGIKKLEQQLEVKLLERTYKGVTLTDEGKKVVALAEKAFAHFDEIEAMFKSPPQVALRNSLNDLTLYSNPAYTPLLMNAVLTNQEMVGHTLQLSELTPDKDKKQLFQDNPNAVVLGILSENHNLPPNISHTILRTSKAYIMCSKNFPYIALDKSSISFKELVKLPLAISKTSFDFQNILYKSLYLYGEPNIKIVAPSHNSVISAVQSGIAYAFSNKFLPSTKTDNLRYISIRNSPKFHLALTYTKNINPQKIAVLAELLNKYL